MMNTLVTVEVCAANFKRGTAKPKTARRDQVPRLPGYREFKFIPSAEALGNDRLDFGRVRAFFIGGT